MPRIRKKTSKRGTSHQRGKIKQKVAETRKKRKKEAKLNPQWKSKQRKDPGIPNSFPYKDQILAEVAEQRRQQTQQLENAKAERAKEHASTEVDDYPSASSSHSSSRSNDLDSAVPKSNAAARAPFAHLQAILESADVVIEVLDARDPQCYRSLYLEDAIKTRGKMLILLLNKIDLCSRDVVQAWLHRLNQESHTVPFRSASACFDQASKNSSWEDAVGTEELLAIIRAQTSTQAPTVALVGLSNVGKSSVLNSLLASSVSPMYKLSNLQQGPTTTLHPLEVVLDCSSNPIRFIDTPGAMWSAHEATEFSRTRDILVRNRGRIDKLKDPLPVAMHIVERAKREDLMVFYNIPAFLPGDVNAFLTAVARHDGLMKNDGSPDTTAACRVVLRDWSSSKLPYYTLPSDEPESAEANTFETVLHTLKTRKEHRKSFGLVRLRAGEVDTRSIDLSASWFEDTLSAGDEDSEESDGDGNGDTSNADESEDGESEHDEADDDEEPASPPPSKPSRPAAHTFKKVSFAAPVKNGPLKRPSVRSATGRARKRTRA